jgi:hypothetical protein
MSMTRHVLPLVLAIALVPGFLVPASAAIILGTGNASLLGSDLTDPENNGDPENNVNYNAIFAASEEPAFGGAESAFNVFDNLTGGGNNKWCCGDQNNFPTNPIWVQATFAQAFLLTSFTLNSGNDTPDRDPRVWQILGSNDGTNFTPIFTQNDLGASVWTARDQTIRWDAGTDFAVQTVAYTTFRFQTTATNSTTGARFQLGEIEFFSVPEPATGAMALAGLALTALRRRRSK